MWELLFYILSIIGSILAIGYGATYLYDRFSKPKLALQIPTEKYYTYGIQPESLDYCPEKWKKQRCLKYYIQNNSKHKSTLVKTIELHVGGLIIHYNFLDLLLDPNEGKDQYLPFGHPLLFHDDRVKPQKRNEGDIIFYSAECYISANHTFGVSKSNSFPLRWRQLDLNKVEEELNKKGWNTIAINNDLLEVEKHGFSVQILNDGEISERRKFPVSEIYDTVEKLVNSSYLRLGRNV